MAAGLQELPGLIPEIVDYHAEPDLGINPTSWDFSVTADFADQAGYLTYRDRGAPGAHRPPRDPDGGRARLGTLDDLTPTVRAMTDTPWLGDACSLVEAFRSGERSPLEELEATLAAIEASDLNAFTFVDGDQAPVAAAARWRPT